MGNSLQDQLLRAGLVSEKKLKQTSKDKHKEQRRQPKGAVDEEKLRLQREQAEKAERDRQLNLEQQAAKDQKASVAQIRQLIEKHRLPKGAGEVAYNFADEGKVQRLYVSETTRDQLAKGRMAVVRSGKSYDVVPGDIAEKILARNERFVVVFNRQAGESAPAAGDDPYADYQVPDDLMW